MGDVAPSPRAHVAAHDRRSVYTARQAPRSAFRLLLPCSPEASTSKSYVKLVSEPLELSYDLDNISESAAFSGTTNRSSCFNHTTPVVVGRGF